MNQVIEQYERFQAFTACFHTFLFQGNCTSHRIHSLLHLFANIKLVICDTGLNLVLSKYVKYTRGGILLCEQLHRRNKNRVFQYY
jgi:hypothetical protein